MNKLAALRVLLGCWLALLMVGCQSPHNSQTITQINNEVSTVFLPQSAPNVEDLLAAKYKGRQPQQWGEKTSGVAFQLDTGDKVVALTFDACGGSRQSNGYDADIINYLNQMHIPATLFCSGQWIKANQEVFLQLSANPLFEIANHGMRHLPCSVNGKSAYGIKGTESISGVIAEIETNQQLIESLTGKQPCFYRSGTNYYDEVGVQIARDLGLQPIGYSVLGDAGATYSRRQVSQALLSAKAGSIVIFHFNHPEGSTAEGITDAIPQLLSQGFRFAKLSDYDLISYR